MITEVFNIQADGKQSKLLLSCAEKGVYCKCPGLSEDWEKERVKLMGMAEHCFRSLRLRELQR